MTILIDVDGTVCDTPAKWLQWINNTYNVHFSKSKLRYYNSFAEMLKDPKIINQKIHPFEFWKNSSLYDDITPFASAVDHYKKIKNKGYKVLFVTAAENFEHMNSKLRFLEKHFPNFDDFILTSKKYNVKGDIIIDDCPKHLFEFKENNSKGKTILSSHFYNIDEHTPKRTKKINFFLKDKNFII